jgi:D-tyrosyl-tRNA(Tyr) deacylase
MKVLVQRVLSSSVTVDGKEVARIGRGYLLLIGIEKGDNTDQADYLAQKTTHLRIFEDENGKMNLSILQIGGQILAVSQFTLAGDTSQGNRPGFSTAATPQEAKPLYEYFCQALRGYGLEVQCGIFQADMKVALINDGPSTFMLERK